MAADNRPDARVDAWLSALDEKHLADLTPSEVARALRALSSLYVERRAKLAAGSALGTAGKRAAFALFYAPTHFLLIRHVLRALAPPPVTRILDLGCGTGSAGAAWGLESPGARISGRGPASMGRRRSELDLPDARPGWPRHPAGGDPRPARARTPDGDRGGVHHERAVRPGPRRDAGAPARGTGVGGLYPGRSNPWPGE